MILAKLSQGKEAYTIMRTYEMTIVMRGDLADEDRTAHLETIQGWVKNNGGNVAKVDNWGRRRLAYEINNQRDGYYTLITAEMPAQAPMEIERNLRFNESVLRFLIIAAES
jgi:small subunit ribosomal protein S6